jgi:hypothetical protein
LAKPGRTRQAAGVPYIPVTRHRHVLQNNQASIAIAGDFARSSLLLRLVATLVLTSTSVLTAAAPVHVLLWFDTEDYVDPASDDAALRIATDLTKLGVRATFKVVGEKARVLESRKRIDVIRALTRHAIGYHSNYHSVHPTPAEYLRHFGFLEGAAEFERRETAGAKDVQRIFGVPPVCYGQPGSSWGPQSNRALRNMGIPVYLDEGEQIGLNQQPFWYGGLLYVFNMGQNQFRAKLDTGAEDTTAYAKFDETVARLRSAGGGVISIYYHPTEFVNTEFWDVVNFAGGANPPRSAWRKPRARTKEDAERTYGVLDKFVRHMKMAPGVQFSTAADLRQIYRDPIPLRADRKQLARHLFKSLSFLETEHDVFSPADIVVQLLGLEPRFVDGPTAKGITTLKASTIPRSIFSAVVRDAADFVTHNERLPNQVFVGAETLALADFVATLANSVVTDGDTVRVTRGNVQFDKYFATDAAKSFRWPIHPDGFAAPELLELGRLQGWTLKPARFRRP